MAISLQLVGAPELARRLALSPDALHAAQERAMTQSLLLVEADARRNVRHDTRRLMNSITHQQSWRGRSLTGWVGPSLRYGLYVERGTRPHWPPIAPLRGWARRHGVNPFAVQRAIARRGTKARPFLVPAYLRHAQQIVRLFAAAGSAVTAALAGPRGGGRGT